MESNNNKVKGSLVGVDGNAFALMGHFNKLARRQGFSKEWINSVLDEARSGDYDHLLQTLIKHMDDSENGEYDD